MMAVVGVRVCMLTSLVYVHVRMRSRVLPLWAFV